MAKKVVYECDVCGAVKKETNNWWQVVINENCGLRQIIVRHFEDDDGFRNWTTACGEQCVTQLVARWMRTGQLDAPQPVDVK